MSDAGPTEPVTVTTDGVTVRKLLERDRFSTPAIAFRLVSERDDPVVLRLIDPLPEDAALDEVGFHPEYGSQFWTAETDQLTFEYRLDAGEEYETVYGLRADDPNQFMAEFEVEATPEEGGSAEIEDVTDVVSAENSEAVRDLITGGDEAQTSDAEVAFEADAGSEPAGHEPTDRASEEAGIEAGLGPTDDADVDDTEPVDIESPIGEPDDSPAEGDESAISSDSIEAPIGDLDDDPQPAGPADSSIDDAVDDAVDDLLGGETTGDSGMDDAGAIDDGAAPDDGQPAAEGSPDGSPIGDADSTEEFDEEESVVSDAADEVLGPSSGSDDTTPTEAPPASEDTEPSDGGTSEFAPDGEPAGGTGPEVGSVSAEGDGIVAAIAEEVRAGEAADEDLETLTEALNLTRPSLESRVRYLQNEMTDLAAYTDALEEFIDEHGSARGLLSELRDGLADVEDKVSDLDARVTDRMDTLDAVEEQVADLDERLDERAEETATVEDELADVQSSIRSLREDLRDIDDLRDDLGGVEETVSDLADDVRDIESDIESVQEFRERFRTVFAGGENEDPQP